MFNYKKLIKFLTRTRNGYLFLFLVFFLISPLIPRVYAAQPPSRTSSDDEAFFIAEKAFDDGFYEVSLRLLERFLKNYPASDMTADVNLLIGKCYFQQNRFIEALNKFESLLDQPAAENIQDSVIYWIAEVHFKGNNFSKAAVYYRKIISDFFKSPYVASSYYSLAWCLFQEHLFSEAVEYFKVVERRFPREPFASDASFKIVESLYNMKDYEGVRGKVKDILEDFSKESDKIPYLYFYLAEANYYSDDFSEAVKEYSKVLVNTEDSRMQSLSRLSMGWSYLKLKQYLRAGNVFSQIREAGLEKGSRDTLLLGRAILFFETQKFKEAEELYSELINLASDPLVLIQAYTGKADSLYNLADYKKAIEVYREAQSKLSEIGKDDRSHRGNSNAWSTPQEIIDKIHSGLAWAFLKEGEFKAAIDEFQKIAKHTGDKIVKNSVLCQIGDAYQDSGDYEKAIQTYDAILKDYPDTLYSDYVQYQLGLTLIKSGKYDGAIMALRNIKINFPNSKLLDEAIYAIGLAYFQKEDYKSSLEIFKNFQEEFKNSSINPQALYLLGTSLYNLGKYNEAIEVFKNITRLYNHDTELIQKAEYEIADCYYQMGNEREAMIKFKMLRSKYPDSRLTAEVIWWLGEYYYRNNSLSLARRYFYSLIQDFPKSSLVPDAYYALGSIYEAEFNYEEAMDNFKKVIELNQSDLAGTSMIAIADIYLKQNKYDSALEMYKDAVSGYKNLSAVVFPKIAEVYRKRGEFNKAMDFYQKSLEAVSVREMSDIQFKIAELSQERGDSHQAIEEYLKVGYLYSENNQLVIKALLRVAAIFENKEDFKAALNIYEKIISMQVEESKYAKERVSWIKKYSPARP